MPNFWRNMLLVILLISSGSIHFTHTNGIEAENNYVEIDLTCLSGPRKSRWTGRKWTRKMHKEKCYGYYLAI